MSMRHEYVTNDKSNPYGRLSWLHVSFLPHVKYTLSYRMSMRMTDTQKT